MGDLKEEILALRQKKEQNCRQFLWAELQTCFVAIDRARFELSMGDIDEAGKEFAITLKGMQVIERFLGKSPGQVTEIEARLAELKVSLHSLKQELETFAG